MYGGLSFNSVKVRQTESVYSSYFAIGTYYGGYFKWQIIDNVFNFGFGGEIGSQFNFYSSNFVSGGGTGVLLETTLGLSPLIKFNWRPGESWFNLSAGFKYNAYFSLNDAFYFSSFAAGVHQWLQPSIGFMFYI